LNYLNLKNTAFPISKASIKASRAVEFHKDIVIARRATNAPKIICLLWLFGVVIGSGSITVVKKRVVGSVIEFRINPPAGEARNLELKVVFIRMYTNKKDRVIR